MGDYDGALDDLDMVVELYGCDDPDMGHEEEDDDLSFEVEAANDLIVDRAFLRLRMRDLEGANEDMDLAMSRMQSHEWLLYLRRAEFYARQKRRKEAIADFDTLITRGGEYPRHLKMRARLKEKVGDKEGAAKDWERIRQILAEQEHNRQKALRREKARKKARLKKLGRDPSQAEKSKARKKKDKGA